jgi:hypothetical protein
MGVIINEHLLPCFVISMIFSLNRMLNKYYLKLISDDTVLQTILTYLVVTASYFAQIYFLNIVFNYTVSISITILCDTFMGSIVYPFMN